MFAKAKRKTHYPDNPENLSHPIEALECDESRCLGGSLTCFGLSNFIANRHLSDEICPIEFMKVTSCGNGRGNIGGVPWGQYSCDRVGWH